MVPILRSAVILFACLHLGALASCSFFYDADDLPRQGDAADTTVADAMVAAPADANESTGDAAIDSDATPPDAAPPPFDAAVNPGECGDADEMCCETEPACGFGDHFVECDKESNTCQPCGYTGGTCCDSAPLCDGILGCALDLCL